MLKYWVGAYILYGKSTEVLVISSKDIRLEIKAEKTKYMVMSREQNAGQTGNRQVINPLKLWNSLIIGNNPNNSEFLS
jgi:hypothetical protein